MESDQGFLLAILADPEDDAPRLIHADWLDDNGDPERAEFIRAQVELARLKEDDPRWGPLKRRERELLARHAKAWTAGLSRRVNDCAFRRGYVESLRVSVPRLLAEAKELFRLAPLTELHLERTS